MDNKRCEPSVLWPNGRKPSMGDIARGKDVGRLSRSLHVWDACPNCGAERWIKLYTKGILCSACSSKKSALKGELNPYWGGGKRHARNGIFITVTPDNPFFSMAHKSGGRRCIAEHRLVMAQHLGRCLKSWEVVHHIDRNDYNNSIDNLLLLPSAIDHLPFTALQVRVDKLEGRIAFLEAENVRLETLLSIRDHGNAELNEGSIALPPKCVESIDHPSNRDQSSQEDENVLHPQRKL